MLVHKFCQATTHSIVITIGHGISTGNLMKIMIESGENWNVVNGFIRKILETEEKSKEDLSPIN